ncbi:hypothetical protein JBE04_17975 [Streptomyces sp. PRKS01-29]|nr:hypothetical protein [Streptomyces sabulosicollis]MBI0296300.1 hypothetical protein [Streptomyces sabulosicollis]
MARSERARILAQYRAAKDIGDLGWGLELMLEAVEYDRTHPGEPRLMDELRAAGADVKAVA